MHVAVALGAPGRATRFVFRRLLGMIVGGRDGSDARPRAVAKQIIAS
jgi:hypothetical protein